MDPQKRKKLRREIDALRRRGGIRPRELEALATALGRKRHPTRGKDPSWVSELPHRWPISIPNLPGDLKKGTALSILEELEADLDSLEELNDTPDQG